MHISNRKYRAIVSDVLPYERPIFFSNRMFVRLLDHYGVRTENGRLVATRNTKNEPGLDVVLRLLGGVNGDRRTSYQYAISRGEEGGKTRILTIIHPYHQVEMAEFYEQYRMLLIDFCRRSEASLRYPERVAEKQEKGENIEHLIFDRYASEAIAEGIKHYFTYERCENINQFYEHALYYEAEKRFAKMLKTDLKECFESIRIDDLSRATFGREMRDSAGSFVERFAQLEHKFADSERGIVIGPDFSRIYAEMILQKVDSEAEKQMKEAGYRRGEDYVFYRYVDDGFLFYDTTKVQKEWEMRYEKALAEYELRMNPKKRKVYAQRPFVDKIAKVKKEIAGLIDELFVNRLETFKGFVKLQRGIYDTPTKINYAQFVKAYRLIMMSGEGEVAYKDITVYTLGMIRKHVMELLEAFDTVYRDYKSAERREIADEKGREIMKQYEQEFLDYVQNMVHVLFFLLTCDMRMVTSVRVVQLVHAMQLFVRGMYRISHGVYSSKFPTWIANALDEEIADEMRMVLQTEAGNKGTTMEVLNLLNLQRMMSPNARISEEVLMGYLKRGQRLDRQMHFFTAFELLHYLDTCEKGTYGVLRKKLEDWAMKQIRSLKEGNSRTEAVLTCMEVLCDPAANEYLKRGILVEQGLSDEEADNAMQFIDKQKELFIKWRKYKIDHEVVQFENNNVY